MTRGHDRRTTAHGPVVACAVAVLATALTGCTTSGPGAPAPETTALETTTTPPGVRAPQAPSTGPAAGRTNPGTGLDGLGFPAVVPRPRGERILLEASLRTGVAQVPMTPFTEGTLVTVRIACRGSGTIQVYVPDVYGGTSACRPDGDHVDTSTVRGPGAETDGATPGAGGVRSSAVTVVANRKQQWAVTVSERATPDTASSPAATSTGRS